MKRALVRFALLPCLVVAALAPFAFAQPPAPPAPAPSASVPTIGPPTAAKPTEPTPPPAAASGTRSFTDSIPCSACHTTTGWRTQGASGDDVHFDHSTTGFPLTGQHLGQPCVACHNASRATKRACASCHEDFHKGRLTRSCDNCHSAVGWRAVQPLAIHRMTRFALTGMHVLADCSECHRRASEHRWTGAPIDCFACHEKDYRRPDIRPVHVGTATTAPFPRDCSQCHRAMAFVPATVPAPVVGSVGSPLRVAPRDHDLRFPISFGQHRTASCDDCHGSLAAPRAVRCVGCHVHDPVTLMQQHKRPMATDGPSCLSCHPGGARR